MEDWRTENSVVEIEGRRLNVRRLRLRGASPERLLLVFLHEGLGSIELWRDFPSALSRATGCDALIYDRMGHGRSSGLTEVRTSDYLHLEAARFLPPLVERFAEDRVVLVGHSDGGSIALLHAAGFPDRVAGVITEAAHISVEPEALAGIRRTVALFREGGLRERLFRYHGENTDALFRGWSETWLAPWFRGWNIEACLEKIHSPLLVIQGADDEYGTTAQVDAITEKSAGPAKPVLIEGCAHVPHLQAAERVLAAMKRFVMECSAAR